MLLKDIVPERKAKQFASRNIYSTEDLLEFFPKAYNDRTALTGVLLDSNEESVVMVQIDTIRYRGNYKKSYIQASGKIHNENTPITILWWNDYLYEKVKDLEKKTILICGKIESYNSTSCGRILQMSNPSAWTEDIQSGLKIYPKYASIKGMSQDYHANTLEIAYKMQNPLYDPLGQDLCNKYSLMSYYDAIKQMHYPDSMELLKEAQKRILWNELFYFAMRIELDYCNMSVGSQFQFPILRYYNQVKQSLPFTLTMDQESTLNGILQTIQDGRRVNALVQGDVGSGKSIVAFLLMIAACENDYQAVLMAPTQILAHQHYEDIKKLVEPFGIDVAFVSGKKLKKAEQKQLEDGVSNGSIRLIVGTQALLSQGLEFKNLALIVTDEEHRYGVKQRESLVQKASGGVHVISMSATPIPRTLAQTLYGSRLDIYSIKTKPAGRQPVLTGLYNGMDLIYEYICKQTENHRQIYIICPLVEDNEKIENVQSVESVYAMYQKALAPYGVRIAAVTGKTKKTEASQILNDFTNGDIDVLVSTTLVEVGVNVPSAVGIIIHNAERFGLAQLHQLRGRVGRSSLPSTCCLVSDDRNNERLKVLCSTNDGFEIAEADLKLRGAGDFIGTKQSGTEKYLSMAISHSTEYQQIQAEVRAMLREGRTCPLLEKAIEDKNSGVGGIMREEGGDFNG